MKSFSQRVCEILPGALVWLTLTACVVCSLIRPLWMVYFVILFDFYWLLRILYFLPFLITSWYRYRQALRRNWQQETEALPGYERIHHLIFLPFAKEDPAVIRETLRVLASTVYPAKRMLVILGGEGRYSARAEEVRAALEPEFRDKFFALFFTVHPPDIAGEVVGKGSNLHWMAEQIVPKLLARGLVPEQIIVSSFDVDTIVHPQYFSCLAYHYLTDLEPTKTSYQPVALLYRIVLQAGALNLLLIGHPTRI